MNILLVPVPLWALLIVLIISALIVAVQYRRSRQRMDDIDRVIDNMDRWADEIEERLFESEQRSGRGFHETYSNNNATRKRSHNYY
jgi:hypothetical protein